MSTHDEPTSADVTDRAGDWLVANDDGPLGTRQAAELTGPLKAAPTHIEEFLGMSVIARDLRAAVTAPTLSVEALVDAVGRDEHENGVAIEAAGARGADGRQAWPTALAAGLAAVTVAVSLWWWARDQASVAAQQVYATVRGEQAIWRLADGSVLHVNADGRVSARFSPQERVLELERGQAFFEIAHGDARRFRVAAGDAQIVATGTQFDVYRRGDATLVTVIEGSVSLSAGAPPALRVAAGQQAGVEHGQLWPAPRVVDSKASVAWLHRQVIVQDRPLAEVVEEFNRYARAMIEIDNAAVRAVRVSGAFDAYDTESFIAFLASLDGIVVEKSATRIRVLSHPYAQHEDSRGGR